MSKNIFVELISRLEENQLNVFKLVIDDKKTRVLSHRILAAGIKALGPIVEKTPRIQKIQWKKIPLLGQEEVLVIEPIGGVKFEECRLLVKGSEDVEVMASYTHAHWKVRIPESDDPGVNAPADITLTISRDEPDN